MMRGAGGGKVLDIVITMGLLFRLGLDQAKFIDHPGAGGEPAARADSLVHGIPFFKMDAAMKLLKNVFDVGGFTNTHHVHMARPWIAEGNTRHADEQKLYYKLGGVALNLSD
jgi:hypothetical protein